MKTKLFNLRLLSWLMVFIFQPLGLSAQINVNYVLTETMLDSDGTHGIRTYQFCDGLGRPTNRLTNAVYGENESLMTNSNRYDEKVLEYDANGNMKRFQRRGLKQDGEYGKIDNLHITLNGNQIASVADDAELIYYEGAMDFPMSKGQYSTCTYNGNGSLTSDTGRGIAYIDYDDFNNPRRIQFTNGNVTRYVYSATGEKLRTIHYTAVPNISVAIGNTHDLSDAEILSKDSTDYLGNLILENDHPSMYLFDGGYCSLQDKEQQPDIAFHYYTKDHLGNNRVVSNEDGTVEQVTSYYPFGLPYCDNTIKNRDFQKYKYNGKELDLTHGLNTYEYGARQYDAILCIWDRVDKHCENYYNLSPYRYCHNNPIGKNVLNLLGIHEFKIHGLEKIDDEKTTYQRQMADPSWIKTSKEFKQQEIKNANNYK